MVTLLRGHPRRVPSLEEKGSFIEVNRVGFFARNKHSTVPAQPEAFSCRPQAVYTCDLLRLTVNGRQAHTHTDKRAPSQPGTARRKRHWAERREISAEVSEVHREVQPKPGAHQLCLSWAPGHSEPPEKLKRALALDCGRLELHWRDDLPHSSAGTFPYLWMFAGSRTKTLRTVKLQCKLFRLHAKV